MSTNWPRPPKNRFVHPMMAQLRQIRLDRKITSISMSERVGVLPTVFTNWEKGKVQPRLNNLFAWANALGKEIALKDVT